jgi:hypothetical protein
MDWKQHGNWQLPQRLRLPALGKLHNVVRVLATYLRGSLHTGAASKLAGLRLCIVVAS